MNKHKMPVLRGIATSALLLVTICSVAPGSARAAAVSRTPKGKWTRVTDPISNQLHLRDEHTALISGTASPDGTCSFTETGSVPPGGAPVFVEQLAVDSSACVEQVLEGTPTAADLAYLNSLDTSSSTTTASDPSNDLTTSTGTAVAPSPGTAAASTGVVAAAASTTTSAYEKTGYKDPVAIMITSLSANLSWTHTASRVSSASYTIYPHEFQYDGWSNTGTPHPSFNFTTPSVAIQANETFTNTDFEQFLLYTSAAFGGPLAPAAIIAACGFSVKPAVFTHREYIKGNSDGGYNWSFNDSATGGCSDLVNSGVGFGGHFHWTGFGSSS